jgi:hypothetical protein
MMISRVYVYEGSEKKAEEGVGYKVMLPNWKAREGEFQYEVGKTYSMDETGLRLCRSGFHYCAHAIDCLPYYDCVAENKFSQVKIHGKVVRTKMAEFELGDKCATNIIEIYKEIDFKEWLKLCTVTVFIFMNGQKCRENIYVEGILEKKRYFIYASTQTEEILSEICYTRIPNCFPLRYNVEEYRADKTLRRSTKWLGNLTHIAYYDLNGIPIRYTS